MDRSGSPFCCLSVVISFVTMHYSDVYCSKQPELSVPHGGLEGSIRKQDLRIHELAEAHPLGVPMIEGWPEKIEAAQNIV
jgi:hypothetical protein